MEKQNNIEILQDIEELNKYEDITLEDIELIEKDLKNDVLVTPPIDLSENIINAVMPLMNETDNKAVNSSTDKVFLFLQQVKNQMSLINKAFLLSVALVLGTALALNNGGFFNQIFLFSPLIVLFQVFYSYRGIYYNTYEMELACKNSIFDITLARTLIILIFNVGISIALGILGAIIGVSSPFLHVVTTWFAPMILTYYVSLYFLLNKDLKYSLSFGGFTWIGYVVLHTSFVDQIRINSSNLLNFNIGISIISILMISYLFLSTWKKNCTNMT